MFISSWVVKNVNDAYVENMKNRLDNDIYKFSLTVNMSDESFANNDSGVAIKYKLMLFENRIATTERYFTKALTRRWELICNMLNTLGSNYDFTAAEFTYTRNIPADLSSIAATVQQLAGIVSNETLLAQIPFVNNVAQEIERLKQQEEYTPQFNDGAALE